MEEEEAEEAEAVEVVKVVKVVEAEAALRWWCTSLASSGSASR